METSVNELLLKFQKKKAENDVCQAEKKIKDDELAAIQNGNAKTEGLLNADSDAWKQEISTLKEQLLGYSKICDYVKDKAQAVAWAVTPLIQLFAMKWFKRKCA
ncbi:hypothetical protein PAMP_008180 [Pampus punctatissimus]